jgi:glycosyltransferase involved in cell wall biosynthesis
MGVYNGEQNLPATLDSIFSQQDIDFEVVVIDDGSTDGTSSILQRRVRVEPRLETHRQEKGGLTRALINGIAIARGEFIARQDVGDFSHPQRLRKQLDLLVSNPELAFVSCQVVALGPGGEALTEPEPADKGEAIIASLKTAPNAGMKGPHHGSVMFRRSAYERVGGYRPEFYFAQDLDLWSRLIEVGGLEFVNEMLYQSGFTPENISARYRDQQVLLRDLIREATLQRRNGLSEDDVMFRSAGINPETSAQFNRTDAAAEYFIGSCLFARDDPAAAIYLRRVIAGNPFHLKAWAKLLGSRIRHRAPVKGFGAE